MSSRPLSSSRFGLSDLDEAVLIGAFNKHNVKGAPTTNKAHEHAAEIFGGQKAPAKTAPASSLKKTVPSTPSSERDIKTAAAGSGSLRSESPTEQDPISRRIRKIDDRSCKGSVIGVYIGTNETGLGDVRKILLGTPKVNGGCHIGFSGMHNFDIMAMRKSEYGIICDFNPDNKRFLNLLVDLTKISPNRESFVKKLIAFIKENEKVASKELFQSPSLPRSSITFSLNVDSMLDPDQEVAGELYREGSWLSTDEGFATIKEMALKDKIIAITQDIRSTENFKAIAKTLRDNSLEIDTLYTSNIFEYMETGADKESFLGTVKALRQQDTMVIQVKKGPGLVQEVFSGSD